MKLNISVMSYYPMLVAPYAGAWIETFEAKHKTRRNRVAPYAGAWIETSKYLKTPQNSPVAPYAGAWIETLINHGVIGLEYVAYELPCLPVFFVKTKSPCFLAKARTGKEGGTLNKAV